MIVVFVVTTSAQAVLLVVVIVAWGSLIGVDGLDVVGAFDLSTCPDGKSSTIAETPPEMNLPFETVTWYSQLDITA